VLKKILAILLFSTIARSQDTLLFDSIRVNTGNSFTGMYNNQNGIQFNISGDNTISKQFLTIGTNTTYSLNYNKKIIVNEYQQKSNLSYKDFFITYIYNYSLSRGITNDNSIGVGFGKWWEYCSITYATIYQKTKYQNSDDRELFRHSIRFKLKYEGKKGSISCEYYFQPKIIDIKDNIVYGSIKLITNKNKKISFSVVDNINYRSVSSVKLIHTINLGLNINLKN
jgi:hypothetical protein